MSAIWKNAVSADWTTAADWSFGVPNPSKAAIINASGVYTVAISSADTAQSLTLDSAGATLSETAGGSLTMAGPFIIDAGTVILNGANSFGAPTQLINGTLELGNAAALGTSALTISGGMLIGTASENITNAINGSGTFTLAAADGATVDLSGNTVLNMSSGAINFGHAGDDGTLVWRPVALGVSGTGASVNIKDGTLFVGNGNFTKVLSAAASTNVAAGAKLDIHGHSEMIASLNGAGNVTSSGLGGALEIADGTFSGTITGHLSLTVTDGLLLTGVNNYTDGTTVNTGATLYLQDVGSIKSGVTIQSGGVLSQNGSGSIAGGLTIDSGGTVDWYGSGSLGHGIVDNGLLFIDGQNTTIFSLHSGITGTGSLYLENGSFVLGGTNTYSGGTTVAASTLSIGHAGALGTGELAFEETGNALIATQTEAISNQLVITQNESAVTFLAEHGTRLTLNTGAGYTLQSGPSLTFGSSTDDGLIVWHTPTGSVCTGADVEIAGGILRAGDNNFQTFFANSSFKIDAGATLDIAGVATTIRYLTGSGTIENSGPATTVTLSNTAGTSHFSGTLVGHITLDVGGVTSLGGNAANWSTVNVLPSSWLTLASASSAEVVLSSNDSLSITAPASGITTMSSGCLVTLRDPGHFTGSFAGLQQSDVFTVYGISYNSKDTISYSGDTASGTLAVSNAAEGVSFNFHLIGNYTKSEFAVATGNSRFTVIDFTPSAPVAPSATAHADSFDFTAAAAPHVAPDANVTHMNGANSANDIAFAHDVTEALHAHGPTLDHFTHDLFAHGHGFAEALL